MVLIPLCTLCAHLRPVIRQSDLVIYQILSDISPKQFMGKNYIYPFTPQTIAFLYK